jgi:histidyl-tRNA synthetase
MQKGPVTPKGFRDIDPVLAKKRRVTIDKIASVLDGLGFVPLETPTIEFAETLLGKYGEDEKLIYQFADRGGRKLALRYDLTVPLARYTANNLGLIQKGPFQRYQIGQVFRGENPQKGRYREFTQFDFDTVGSSSLREDAKAISAAIKAAKACNLKVVMTINDRKNFTDTPQDVVRSLDKINKIGRPAVETEIVNRGYSKEKTDYFIEKMLNSQKTKELEEIFNYLRNDSLVEFHDFYFDPSLARGLDYYTGSIFELKLDGKTKDLSIGGGGRYDNLIGIFSGRQIPAVGFSFGLDRLIELVE